MCKKKELIKNLVGISIKLQHIGIIHHLTNKDLIDINKDIFNKKRLLQHALSNCDIQYIRSLISLGADPRTKWGSNKNRNYIDYANKAKNPKVKANILVNLIKDKVQLFTEIDFLFRFKKQNKQVSMMDLPLNLFKTPLR
mgnify:CR=1 FL=1